MESTIKTAVSLPKALFRRAEALAEEMRVSRSKLVALALQDYIVKMENARLIQAINASVSDAMDEDDEKFLYSSAMQAARIAESDPENQS
jgi:metal-responsive CopG/Arc/MetJ family transcriptional regulator